MNSAGLDVYSRMRQAEFASLLPAAPPLTVPGFWLEENYISPEEERILLSQLDGGPWESDWKRRIQQYGYGYSGGHGGAPDWVRDFPEWLAALGQRVSRDAHFDGPAQNCVINEYIPPHGIAPHRDYPAFGPRIACISLGSDIVMDLLEPDSGSRVAIHVPPRSLWILSGEARSKWQHGIAPRLSDVIDGQRRSRSRRVSVTFRTLKHP